MALAGRRFRRRKKEDIFVEGYFIDHINVATPDVNQQDEIFHLFGKDSPETDRLQNYGTLTLAVLDKYTNNQILDLITGNDPAATTARQYKTDDLVSVAVWANVKDAKNTQYVKSWIIQSWSPGMPMPSGNPEAKATVQIVGNGDLPRQFQDAYITTSKVASGAANIGDTPVKVPNETVYAVGVRAINDLTPSGEFEQEDLHVSAAMISSSGAISWTEVLANVIDLDAVTDLFVYYLKTGTGVYPDVLPDKLRE